MANNNLVMAAEYLVLIGALNWGLAVFNFNLVTYIAGLVGFAALTTIVYAAIGLSAVYLSALKFNLLK